MTRSAHMTPSKAAILAVLLSLVTTGWAQGDLARPTPFGAGVMGEAHIQFDNQTGTLIVITDEATSLQLEQLIETLDRPVPQVHINVVIVEVTHANDLDLGTEFFLQMDDSLDFFGNPVRDESLSTNFGLAAQPQGAFYRFLDQELELTLRGLAQSGELEVLSRPSIMARNNESATVIVGQEVPFVQNTRITEFGQVINTVEYEEIGIILEVIPFVNPDNVVEILIYTEISTLSGESVPIAAGLEAPVFAKRSAETQVNVPSGQTVVLGGLVEDNVTETRRGVPFLSKIPLLGLLFQQKILAKAKTELLIFLTPEVVRGGDELVAYSRDETARAERILEAFSAQTLERHLDSLVPRWPGQGVRRNTAPSPKTHSYDVTSPTVRNSARPQRRMPGQPPSQVVSLAQRSAGAGAFKSAANPAVHPGGVLYQAKGLALPGMQSKR